MAHLIHVLVCFVFIAFSSVTTRSIQEDADIEQLVVDRINANKPLSAMITSYRHRFEHSPHFQALRWALKQQIPIPYCDFCDVFIPVVSEKILRY